MTGGVGTGVSPIKTSRTTSGMIQLPQRSLIRKELELCPGHDGKEDVEEQQEIIADEADGNVDAWLFKDFTTTIEEALAKFREEYVTIWEAMLRVMENTLGKHQAAVKKVVNDRIDELIPTFQDIKTKFNKFSDRLQALSLTPVEENVSKLRESFKPLHEMIQKQITQNNDSKVKLYQLYKARFEPSSLVIEEPFFDQDPSRNFDLDPSRILGQPFNPGRRISTRIHDLDFDQDPSRIFDLDFGRNLCLSLLPGRKVSTRIHDLDFDQDPSRIFNLDFNRDFCAYLFPGRKEFDLNPGLIYLAFDLNPDLFLPLIFGCSQRNNCRSEYFESQSLHLASQLLLAALLQMADKNMTRLAKMNVARKSSEFPIRSRYTSLIDMINTRGDEYPSDAHLDVHDHISVLRDPKELDKLSACFKIKEPFKLLLAGSADRACQWRKDALCVYRETLRAGIRVPFHPFIPVLIADVGISPFQLPPNSWRLIMCYLSQCAKHNVPTSVAIFRKICQFKYSPDKNPGWVSLNQRLTVAHIVNGKSIPDNNLGWKKDFLYVLWEGGDWGTLFRSSFGLAVDGSPNDIVLSEEETKAFNLLTQDNGTSHSWDLIRETVLIVRGLSPIPKKMAEKIEEATKPKDLEKTRMKCAGKVFKDPRLGDRFPLINCLIKA
ncbi:hypothetical protein AgCh_018295 [Apium graveolens]